MCYDKIENNKKNLLTIKKPKMTNSICIPRIETTTTKEYIHAIIVNLNIGIIQKIREIPIHNDPNHKRIIIDINWFNSNISQTIRKQLIEQGSIKLVHDMPWYWKIVPTRQ